MGSRHLFEDLGEFESVLVFLGRDAEVFTIVPATEFSAELVAKIVLHVAEELTSEIIQGEVAAFS